MGISITPKDLEIFTHMSRLRFLTAFQTAALFYAKPENYKYDVLRARKAAYDRLEKLAKHGYITSVKTSDYNYNFVKIYYLDRGGSEILRDLRQTEDVNGKRVRERKTSYGYTRGPHDILAADILCNLLLLSRELETFSIDYWLADRDCRYYLSPNPYSDIKPMFDPDLYLKVTSGEEIISMFIEIERGTNTKPVLRRKILRFFQFYASGQYKKELKEELFPRSCFIMSNKQWKSEMVRLVRYCKEYYEGDKRNEILNFPFWITSLEEIDPECITEGRLSAAILGTTWTNQNGENNISPFIR